MLRLTVVTIMGLIGTISTGFLGMNLIDETAAPIETKLAYFGLVTASALAFTVLTIVFSRPIAGLFDWLSGEQRR
jgi:hypothetical protein